MSFISTLTWSCIELQSVIENADISEDEKSDAILKHLKSTDDCDREPFPEFESGWEWFNTKRSLTVNTDLMNQIVIIDFFTYCCINCMHILPDLEALEEKYPHNQSGVVVVGVHSAKFENEKVSANIVAAIQRYGIQHPVVNDSEAVLWNKLEITCWPTLLVLGPDAKPLFVIIGEGHRDVLFRYVEKSLQFYKDRILPQPLPLMHNLLDSFQSHLLFPGKICMIKPGPTAEFSSFDCKANESLLAVSDTGHHRILILSLDGVIKITIGGPEPGMKEGAFNSAKFRNPQGLAFLPPCHLYVADTGNHSIRLVDLNSKEVRTVAGTGVQGTDKEGGKHGTQQPLASPWDLSFAHSPASVGDPDILLIANAGTHQIWGLALRDLTWWKNMSIQAGTCLRLAGSGAEENRNNSYPAKAAFAQPSGLCTAILAGADNLLFIADSESSSIRQINLKDGSVKAVVGGDKDPMNLFCYGDKDNKENPKGPVLLQHPLGVAWNSTLQLLYIADSYNHKIKTLNPITKVCCTYIGNGKPGFADGTLNEEEIQLNEPGGLCITEDGNYLYVADTNNHCIRKINLTLNMIETLKVSAKPSDRNLVTVKAPDFEVSASFPLNTSAIHWTAKFHCSKNWKWTDAPQSWKIKSIEGLEAEEKKGNLQEGEFHIKLEPQHSMTNKCPFLQVQTDLYFCAQDSGICTKKSFVVQLNLKEDSSSKDSKIHHEFTVSP